MSKNIHGFKNESYISEYLNEKKFGLLNENIKNFLCWLFERKIGDNEIVYSDQTEKIGRKFTKPDIWIKISDVKKFISIKIGCGNSVHQEPLTRFCEFLTSIKVPNEIVNNLKLYHFGDDTIDGSGVKRYSTNEIKNKYENKIKQTNDFLNQKQVLNQIIYRVLFIGSFKNYNIVDAIYYGTKDNGLWASREEILNFLLNNNDISASGIHFSYLTYQPWTRDCNRTAKHSDRRYVMQVKWGKLALCLEKIIKGRK